jgi:hypothetical protein
MILVLLLGLLCLGSTAFIYVDRRIRDIYNRINDEKKSN